MCPEADETPLGSPGWAPKRKAGVSGGWELGAGGLGGPDKEPLREGLAQRTMGLLWVAWLLLFLSAPSSSFHGTQTLTWPQVSVETVRGSP